MSKKLLTKLLAFTMSAGLVLQPVAAFAAEPSEGDLTETVVAEEEQTEPEAAEIEGEKVETPAEVLPEVELDRGFNLDSVPILQANPENDPEILNGEEEDLPELQNVVLEGDYLSWDHLPQNCRYNVRVGTAEDWYWRNSANLRELCQINYLKYGEYPVELYAFNGEERLSKTYKTTFNYAKKDRAKVTSVFITPDEPLTAEYGSQVQYPDLSAQADDVWSLWADLEWQVLDGENWVPYSSEYFDNGVYRYCVSIWLDIYKDQFEHVIDPEVKLSVNGKEFTLINLEYDQNDEVTKAIFASEVYDCRENPEEPIGKAEVTSAFIDIQGLGEPRYNSPVIRGGNIVYPEDAVYVATFKGWQMLTETGWETYSKKYFWDYGEYRYCVSLRIKSDCSNDYVLSPDVQLTVNGNAFKQVNISYDKDTDEVWEVTFASRMYGVGVTEEPVEKEQISSACINCDYKDIIKNGAQVREASYEKNELLPIDYKGWWYQKDEHGNYVAVTSDVFTPGTYQYGLEVKILDEYEDECEFAPDFFLQVGADKWERIETLDSRKVVGFISEEITIEGDDPIDPEDPEDPIEDEGQWHEKYGAQYYELPDGKKATGKQKIGEETYFFSNSGTLQKNVFFEEDGNKFYFGSDGKMIKGWFEKWGSTYYADENGAIQTGFVDIGTNTYHFDAAGKRSASVWLTSEGKRFFVKADGRIAKSETIHRWGKAYTFDADGVLIK